MKKILTTILIFSTLLFHLQAEKLRAKNAELSWKGFKIVGSSHEGKLKFKSVKITTNRSGSINGGIFVVDMRSLTCTDIENPTKNKLLVTHLKNNDFFSVKKYPTATFNIKRVFKKKGETIFKGKITIKGVTQDFSTPVEISKNRKGKRIKADFMINRTDFGVKYGSKSYFKNLAANKIISDNFKITFDVIAR